MAEVYRVYDFENDPEKIVRYLYTAFNLSEGIQTIKDEDKRFKKNPKTMKRFVCDVNGELHSSLVLIQHDFTKFKYNLYSIVTSQQMRNQGLLSNLFKFACIWAKENGGKWILSSTDKSNLAAIKWFEKMEFEIKKEDNLDMTYIYRIQ